MKRAIVVGSGGQDGQLITSRLAAEGWEVTGIGRRRVNTGVQRIPAAVSIDSYAEVEGVVREARPDVVYYLAAHHQSSEEAVADDLRAFELSYNVHVRGVLHFLGALSNQGHGALFYAGSSLVFGNPTEQPQTELTPFRPRSPYAVTKAAGIHACQYYREQRGVRASSGILYNHESPLRRGGFVAQKIVRAVAGISNGSKQTLTLGNLSASIDWGYAPDFVEAMIRITELDDAGDFIIATGKLHTVQQFAEAAFARAGLDWHDHVVESPGILTRSDSLRVGDPSRLHAQTGWTPTVSFTEMVDILVDASIRAHGT